MLQALFLNLIIYNFRGAGGGFMAGDTSCMINDQHPDEIWHFQKLFWNFGSRGFIYIQ